MKTLLHEIAGISLLAFFISIVLAWIFDYVIDRGNFFFEFASFSMTMFVLTALVSLFVPEKKDKHVPREYSELRKEMLRNRAKMIHDEALKSADIVTQRHKK